ncbi:MAG: methyltransferase domain-containing protein [Ostreibacterium sp.]
MSKIPIANLTHYGDQSFDTRANHLQKNIYGSDKGKLRLAILQRDLSAIMTEKSSLSVLDAGCGAGLMSKWALSQGHSVLACDSASVMLNQAKSRIGEQINIRYLQSSIQDLPDNETFDVIFCHAVLEWVENQADFLNKLSQLLKPNGSLSLMFYNAWAREMAQLVYGNFDYIDKNYHVRQRVKLNPHWPINPETVEKMLNQDNMCVISRSGIRVFYDIIRDRQHYQDFADDIIRHELRVSQQYPYWQIARYVHFLAQY